MIITPKSTTLLSAYELERSVDMSEVFNFLLYGYMKITVNNNSGEILEASIRKAYQDAASHVLKIKKEEDKKFCKKTATDAIRVAIEELKRGISDDYEYNKLQGYDAWHFRLCDDLCNIYKDCTFKEDSSFTYGIAQKWVNMTIKYLYLMYGWKRESGDESFMNEYECMMSQNHKFFHVPLDSFMFKAIKVSSDKIIFKAENVKGLGIDCQKYGLTETWSKIADYKAYIDYQKAIRMHELFRRKCDGSLEYSPIDWENLAWIEQSKKENLKK